MQSSQRWIEAKERLMRLERVGIEQRSDQVQTYPDRISEWQSQISDVGPTERAELSEMIKNYSEALAYATKDYNTRVAAWPEFEASCLAKVADLEAVIAKEQAFLAGRRSYTQL